jgi:Response regulator of the LytR/AlgR family
MLKIAVCIVQEEIQTKYLEQFVQIEEEQTINVAIEKYKNGKQLLFEWSEQQQYADILFLEMDKIDGMEIAHELRRRGINLPIVFLTNDKSKIFETFDVGAIYCIDTEEMSWRKQCQLINNALQKAEEYAYQHIIFTNREQECKVLLKDIQYFEVIDHQITMHYQRRNEIEKQFRFCGTIGKLGVALSEKGFIYPHRAYVVSKNYVKQMANGKLILMNDIEIKVGRLRMQEVKEQMSEML